MMNPYLLYISPKGGSIFCVLGEKGRMFRVCSNGICVDVNNLHSAKEQLELLELRQSLPLPKSVKPSPQRKTTLKWNTNGELSAVDMARILDKLSKPELTECELACKVNDE